MHSCEVAIGDFWSSTLSGQINEILLNVAHSKVCACLYVAFLPN